MEFHDGTIDGVLIKPITKHHDERGWLAELFRQDEIDKSIYPVMAYLSVTYPGVTRGPHAHESQTDYFVFLGPSDFLVVMWDNRKDSPTFGCKMSIVAGESNPAAVAIPPGIAHGYKNIGTIPGVVINLPNRLYGGKGKREKVDEIRYEDDPDTPFKII